MFETGHERHQEGNPLASESRLTINKRNVYIIFDFIRETIPSNFKSTSTILDACYTLIPPCLYEIIEIDGSHWMKYNWFMSLHRQDEIPFVNNAPRCRNIVSSMGKHQTNIAIA